jgi:hypothetical protein
VTEIWDGKIGKTWLCKKELCKSEFCASELVVRLSFVRLRKEEQWRRGERRMEQLDRLQ